MSVYWVDIIKEIVNEVVADTGKPTGINADAPYYIHGHPIDIMNQLTQRSRGAMKFKKWPVICLLQDFDEENGQDMTIDSEVNLNIVICMNTKSDYIGSQRYDATFRPTLQPLYELFIEKIAEYNSFIGIGKGLVPHIKTDRLYWGNEGNTANKFSEYIDAIEISDLNLKYKYKKC